MPNIALCSAKYRAALRKAKGISDTDRADQQAAAGHLDGRITARVYDRLPQPVKPSGKG